MKKQLNKLLELLFPAKQGCAICGREARYPICAICSGSILHLNGKTCMKCGKSIREDYEEQYCPDCRNKTHYFDYAFSCFEYEGMGKNLIHMLKYEGRRELAKPIADFMRQRLEQESLDFQAIVPVPIHPSKLERRGFNQTLLIAEYLAALFHLPVTDCIIRTRETKEQYNLDKFQRAANVIDAFSMNIMYNISNYKTVLLLDDIYTTGSTANECSRLLKRSGIEQVYVITAATGTNT